MLQFLRKNQKILFLLITVVVIFSFTFFGTSSAVLSVGREQEERVIAQGEDGKKIYERDVKALTQFFQTPQGEEFFVEEILQSQIASLLYQKFEEELSPIFASKWKKVKQYRPYTHPVNPKISATSIWEEYLPRITSLLHTLKTKTPTFEEYVQLYLAEKSFPPHFLRRLLFMRQMESKVQEDPKLYQSDLALFGYHSLREWFSDSFLDLASLYLLKGASHAEKIGVVISEKEIHDAFAEKKGGQIHPFMLPYLGKLLQYKAVTQHIALLPSLDQDFHQFAGEKVVIEEESLPHFFTEDNRYEIALYLTAVYQSLSPERIQVENRLPALEVEKSFPELVYQNVDIEYQKITKKDLALQIPTKNLFSWQLSNWEEIASKFSLDIHLSEEKRAAFLLSLSKEKRKELDTYAQEALVTEELAMQALQQAPFQEEKILLSTGYSNFAYPIEKNELEKMEIGEPKVFKIGDDILRIAVVAKGDKEVFSLTEAFDKNILTPLLDSYLEKQYTFFEREGTIPKGKSFADVKDKICYTFFAEGILPKDFAAFARSADFPIDPLIGIQKRTKEVTKGENEYTLAFILQEKELSSLQKDKDRYFWFTVKEKSKLSKPELAHQDFAKEILQNQAKHLISTMQTEGKELLLYVP